MSAFLTPLWLEDVNGTDWVVAAPFRYDSDLLKFGNPDASGIVTVPAGTQTDLASIPRVLRGLAPKSGKWNRASVLHDASYHGCLRTEAGEPQRLIKPLCDQLFLEAMLLAGVNRVQARLMYRMVAAFGQKVQRP